MLLARTIRLYLSEMPYFEICSRLGGEMKTKTVQTMFYKGVISPLPCKSRLTSNLLYI